MNVLLVLIGTLGVLCVILAKDDEIFEGSRKGGNRGQKRNKNGMERKKRFDFNPNKIAMEVWAASLTEKDYNYTDWRIKFHSSSTSEFFNGYARTISQIFKENDAKVNFAMIGACDGTGDNTIKHIYLPNDHWRGVFVEPMSLNVRDLVHFMADKNVSHRSIVIQAAATSVCKEPTIKIERPLYEEKMLENKTAKAVPHWLRRQIGSILPANRDHARKEWQIEEVRCMTGQDILNEWTLRSSSNKPMKQSKKMEQGPPVTRKRRPHVLKIDVEGHDYEVLISFLSVDTPVEDLPLIIDFEGKSIAKQYPAAKARMEALGYAVSPFSHDGFAILRAERVFEAIASLGKGGRPAANKDKAMGSKTSSSGTVGDGVEVSDKGASGEGEEDGEESLLSILQRQKSTPDAAPEEDAIPEK